jgi:cell division protein FtsL
MMMMMAVVVVVTNLYLVNNYRQMLKIHRNVSRVSYKEKCILSQTSNHPKHKKCFMLLAVFTYLTNGLDLMLLI